MKHISTAEIEGYIEGKYFSNPKSANPYRSVLTKFAYLANQVDEDAHELYQRFIIGRSSSSAQFAKSVIFDFVDRRSNSMYTRIQEEAQEEETQEEAQAQAEEIAQERAEEAREAQEEAQIKSSISSAQMEEQLRQEKELAKIQAENLEKTKLQALKMAEELEQKKREEQLQKAEEELRKRREAREARIQARIENFVSQEFPGYIQEFDYIENIPQKAREYFQQDNEESMFNLCADMGKHVILEGVAGSGKSELVIKYAKDNEIPLFKMSCSSDARMDDLIGSKTISDNGESIKFQAGMLLKAVLTANKHGKAIILLDEINTLAEKVQKNLNGLADGTGFIDLPMGRIAINPGVQFLICGTMNLSYAGTNPLNPELKDRFAIVSMPTMSKETKHKIYSNYVVDEALEDNLIELSEKLAKMQEDQQVSGDVVFSTRSQIAFLEIYEELRNEQVSNTEKSALDITLISKFSDIEDKQAVKELVNEIFN